MANDPFLTKKSIAGLAERVLLSPPPEAVEFDIKDVKEGYTQARKILFKTNGNAILEDLQIGQIAYGYGEDVQVLISTEMQQFLTGEFICSIQKIRDDIYVANGYFPPKQEYAYSYAKRAIILISLYFNTITFLFNGLNE